MSLIAIAVQHMMAAGMDSESIVAAIAAMEAGADNRTTGAKRQARYRERNKTSQSVTRDDCPPPYDNTSIPPQSSSEAKASSEDRARGAKDAFVKPDWADDGDWADFRENRRRKKKPNSPSAYKKFTDAIARLSDDEWPPGRLLNHAAAEGWAGIYDPRETNGSQNGRLPATRQFRPEPAMALGRIADVELDADRASGYQETGGGTRLALPDYLTN